MKKTIKIIDLLNKIANGEEIKKIKFDGIIFELEDGIFKREDGQTLSDYCFVEECLTDEVEIIEEDKKIEKKKIECLYVSTESNKYLVEKINELVRAINELKKGE